MSTGPIRRFGKYELQERLGHGGMAEVWKAYDTQLQRYVAIKLLHPNLQANPTFATRFQREAQVIASLRHPNIVQIYDFQVSQPPESNTPTAYMVMAYVEGRTLADYIANTSAKGNIPSPVEIVNLCTSISLAVDYAHQKGMIHRDIKPANILLDQHDTARNPMGEPILTDFGLAKLLGSAGTLTATSLGTPLYTSPEQALGYAGNERSDIYSLGVILYEVVTGVPPFRGDSPMAVLTQHLDAVPTSPVLLNPNIPPALTLVIMTALAKDPNARFARTTAMTTALADALNVPSNEGLSEALTPLDADQMPTYFSSSPAQMGVGAAASSTSSFTPSSLSISPASGAIPAVSAANGKPGILSPGYAAPQLATPASWQPLSASGSAGEAAGGSPQDSFPSRTGAIEGSDTLAAPAPPASAPLSLPTRGRWKDLYTALVALLILVLLGSGLGTYFAFFYKNSPPSPVPSGRAFFLSSGQFDTGTAQGIADELQIQLQHIPDPQPGKSYYAWLLGDRQPHAEVQPLQPPPQFTLPLLLGRLPVGNGNASRFYPGTPQHDNLFSLSSRLLITEEDTNGPPRGPGADRSAWRYYAEIPQTLYGNSPLSALDHIRHLFYKETRVAALGLPGGLDVWLFRNTRQVLEWSISARLDYYAQVTDPTLIHNLFLSILDYLDGAPNVQVDVPGGSPLAADPTISRVALLSVTPAQLQGTDVANNPPGYLDHVALHLNGVVKAPDATPQMRTLATQIIEALNNAKMWLTQVRGYAQQLVKMDAVQLSQPSTQTILDNMLLYATYAYIGKLDLKTNQVVPGILQVHYDIQRLATLTLTSSLPQNL